MTDPAQMTVGDDGGRVCACGCGTSLEGRDPRARYHDAACRARGWKAETGYGRQDEPQVRANASSAARLTPPSTRNLTTAPAAERFAVFHAENPQVYRELLRLARQAKTRGAKRVGLKMLWEVVRWNRELYLADTAARQGVAFNNDFTAYYARLLMDRHPELDGLFETRGNVVLPAALRTGEDPEDPMTETAGPAPDVKAAA